MINRSSFDEMKVAVAYGENHFTMSRGSFKYNQKISKKRFLDKTGPLVYVDKKSGETYEFQLSDEAGRLKLELKNELPEGVNRIYISIPCNKGEHFYGCGETYSKFDLSGEKVRIWVAEHQNANRITKKILKEKVFGKHPKKTLRFDKYESYYAQPTFMSSDKYYVHCDVNAYSEFDFTKDGEITFYFQEKPVIITESADSFPELSEKLTSLLGRQRRLPDWLYEGGILAVQEGTDKIQEKIDRALAAGVQINGIWSQDWSGCRRTGFGYQVMWNWKWDEELYPNLDQKIQEWKEQGIAFLGYINPFMAIEKPLYQEASKNGYCVKDKEGKDYLVTITTFPAAMIDFTNPEAYEWYKNLIKQNMIGLGMGGWMADFGEYLPVDSVLFDGDPTVLHNQWPAIWARLNREAIEECGKENEVFFFTRAGHTGTVKDSAMMWTGDQHVDWSVDDGIGSVIPATLSLACSGYGITHSDVGGYTTVMHMRRSKELLLRWEEMNAFSPLFRTHEGNQPVNDVQFDDDEELLEQLAKFTKVHKNLQEYLKELVSEAENNGTPVMRPLFYHYDEPRAYVEKAEYLLGKDMLVCPVLNEGANTRCCYLPKDKWVSLFTKKEYEGGVIVVDAPIGCPPVFVRKDSAWFDKLMKVAE